MDVEVIKSKITRRVAVASSDWLDESGMLFPLCGHPVNSLAILQANLESRKSPVTISFLVKLGRQRVVNDLVYAIIAALEPRALLVKHRLSETLDNRLA